MMGLKVFLSVLFFIGVNADGSNPLSKCENIINSMVANSDSIESLSGEQQLNVICVNMSSFINCVNNAVKDETGFTLRELAELLISTDIGKALTILVNAADVMEDLCTDGTQLHDDYVADIDCFAGVESKQCMEQASGVYDIFRQLGLSRQQNEEPCVVAGYQLGCIGAAVKEECGNRAFDTYKEVVKRLGLFKSGLCASDLMDSIKTSLLDALDISESERILYRVILELKKRRK